MMTGYGHNSNLVQQPPVLSGVDGQWAQHVEQAQYYPGSDVSGLTDPLFYGSMNGWYPTPPCFDVSAQTESLGFQYPETIGAVESVTSVSQPFHMMNTNLVPPPQPRVSISDEELYQALNMSPITVTSSTTNVGYHPSHLQQPPPQQHLSTDYLTTDICYPSTSSYESSGYHDRGYQYSTIPPDDPHHHDGDDEESFGEPERYDTVSPTFSCHSFAPTSSTNPAEADTADLEVELINHLKPNPVYVAPDGFDIFLHTGTTDDTEYNDDDDSRPTTTFSHRSPKAPSPPASRPAYAQKLTAAAHQKKPETSILIPDISEQLYLQTTVPPPPGFTPLLTPNSDALLQKKLSEAVHHQPPRSHALYPAFPPQQSESSFSARQSSESYYDSIEPFKDPYAAYVTQSVEGLIIPEHLKYQYLKPVPRQQTQDTFSTLLDSFEPLPPAELPCQFDSPPVYIPELLTSPHSVQVPGLSAPVQAPRLSDQELETESQKLAIDVVSNLFTSKKEIVDRAATVDAPKKPVARNLFCNDDESLKKLKTEEIVKMNVLDDWETADDNDLAVRMENLLKDVKKEEKKKPQRENVSSSLPSSNKASDWDPNFLPHVLEIYGVPDYAMQEDVVKAMETIGFGDAKVVWIERKAVFAAFENVGRAKNCLTMGKHDWLRFRSLASSSKLTQGFAKSHASSLGIPKKKQQTTATVARRMVEHALGKKANVTAEKRQEERSQLAAARAAKKNTIQWD